jgi:hypothetical protein
VLYEKRFLTGASRNGADEVGERHSDMSAV